MLLLEIPFQTCEKVCTDEKEGVVCRPQWVDNQKSFHKKSSYIGLQWFNNLQKLIKKTSSKHFFVISCYEAPPEPPRMLVPEVKEVLKNLDEISYILILTLNKSDTQKGHCIHIRWADRKTLLCTSHRSSSSSSVSSMPQWSPTSQSRREKR